MRFPVEVVRRTREAVGDDFILIYRLSMLDLVEGGQTWDEVVALAHGRRGGRRDADQHRHRLARGAGADDRHAGAARRPSPGSRDRASQGRGHVPVIASNRINIPETSPRRSSRRGDADMVSMARPLLADPDFVAKAAAGRGRRDQHLHRLQPGLSRPRLRATSMASCLVNPRAAHETELVAAAAARLGAGGARSAFAVGRGRAGGAGGRGDRRRARPRRRPCSSGRRDRRPVPAGDADPRQGGVRGDAALLQPAARGHRRRRSTSARAPTATSSRAYDEVVVATGVVPADARDRRRRPPERRDLRRRAHRAGRAPARRVAVIGAGGIGVDVSHFLTHDPADGLDDWMAHWGVGDPALHPGGLTEPKPRHPGPRGDPGPAQDHADRDRARQDQRLGPSRRAQAVRGPPGPRRVVRPDRRRRPPPDRGRRADDRSRSTTSCSAPARSRSGACTTSSSRPAPRPHLIGGADVAAELDAEARDRAGHPRRGRPARRSAAGPGASLDCPACGSPSSAVAISERPTPRRWPSSGTRSSAWRSTPPSAGRSARAGCRCTSPGLADLLSRHVASGRLRFTDSYEEVAAFGDLHFLCVGTPQKPEGLGADVSQVEAAVDGARPPPRPARRLAGRQVDRPRRHRRAPGRARLAALAPAGDDALLAWNPEFLREGFARRGHPAPRPDRARRRRRPRREAAARLLRPDDRRRHAGRGHRLRDRRAGQGRRQRVPGHQDLVHQRDGRGLRGDRRRRRRPRRLDRVRRAHRPPLPAAPASASAAAACPRTSGRSCTAPASSGSRTR